MSTKNKKSVASQALLDMDNITSAIKEESKNTLHTLLAEAVRDALREDCNEEDDEEKDYDVISDNENDADDNDEKDSDKSAKSDVDEDGNEEMAGPANGGMAPQQGANPQMQGANNGAQEAPMGGEGDEELDGEEGGNPAVNPNDESNPSDEGDGQEGLDDFSKYQVGDNTYDLTGEDDYDKVVKVYKLLNDDDQVVVKKDGDTIHLKDGENNTEYVIDLGSDDEDASAEAVDGEDDVNSGEEGLNESSPAGFNDNLDGMDNMDDTELDDTELDDSELDDSELDDSLENDDDNFGYNFSENNSDLGDNAIQSQINDIQSEIDRLNGASTNAEINENKTRKPMKRKEQLYEVNIDLGYTDNYQGKDVIAGLSNNEPSKSGKSWHKGVPTGTSKPWAGDSKSKGDPFKKTEKVKDSVDEMDMPMDNETPVEEGTTIGSNPQRNMGVKKHIPAGRKEYGPKPKHHISTEASYDELVAENKMLKERNKKLTESVIKIYKNLSEAYITNSNLGKITKLFLENATSQSEKIDIVNRFSNEARTVEQSKALYESINRELKKTSPKSLNINESSMSANGSKMLNEEKVYKTNDLMKTIDLMNRVDNI